MRFLSWCKDGGPESPVSAFWLLEIKSLFSVGLLRFGHGTRSAYHSHAFNSWSWLLRGELLEQDLNGAQKVYFPGFRWIRTRRETFHRVKSYGTSWVLTVRGPWKKTWREYDPTNKKWIVLSNGRVVVEQKLDLGSDV